MMLVRAELVTLYVSNGGLVLFFRMAGQANRDSLLDSVLAWVGIELGDVHLISALQASSMLCSLYNQQAL